MESKDIFNLYEAYTEIYSPQEVDEATAMAKRGYDETKLRQRAGGGEAADRASALEKKPTYGDSSKAKQRSEYARKQRGDFRKTSSSSPGLHGYGHKSDDPTVKAKQAARGAQRGALTPNERKQLNMGDETFDIFDVVLEFLQAEGYAETLEEAEWMMANLIDEEAIEIILGGEQLDEADSIAKMRERAAKRRQQRYGKQGGGGRDDFRPYTKADYERGAANDPRKKVKEDFELWVNELVEEGYDLSDYTWDKMYEFYLDEAITSEKGKAKMKAMLDARTTASGRAKAGKGENVAQIKHIGRANVDGYGGTPPNIKVAKNPVKSNFTGLKTGSGNKASRRAGTYQEEFKAWLDEAMTNYEKNRKRAAQRAAARNAARDQGKTGAVPGVGYVTPRRERETWTDESGKTRHAKGL